MSQGSSLDADSLPQGKESSQLFQATVTDIQFRSCSNDVPTTRTTKMPLAELFASKMLDGISYDCQGVRWIHLPANNMAWVEELLKNLHEEQNGSLTQSDRSETRAAILGSVLRDDLWRRAFHGRLSKDIHTRFMIPLAASYRPIDLESSESDDSDITQSNTASVTALYMPYLHWETYNSWKDRQKRIAHLKDLKQSGQMCDCLAGLDTNKLSRSQQNEALLHEHLYHNGPIHDRRTLDQSYYYNLDKVARRDEDQVIGQHTWREAWRDQNDLTDPKRKMMMVDQLWMWVIDGHTIVTAFPETSPSISGEYHDDSDDDDDCDHAVGADVLDKLLVAVPQAIRQRSVKTTSGLMALIIDCCTGVFNRSDIHPDLAFLEAFAIEIGKAKFTVNQMLLDFSLVSHSIESLWTDRTVSFVRMSRELELLFAIKREIELLGDIERIMNDLAKIDFICGQQEEVVQNLLKCSRSSKSYPSKAPLPLSSSRSLSELYETIKSRRNSWSEMNVTASELHKSLHRLLDLKQRQAAVSEARTVRNQIAISAQQGYSIMILTIFTVLLLPPSVIAAVFGMNAKEWVGDPDVPFRTISAIMIPTTAILTLLTLLFAFSERTRRLASRLYQAACPDWTSKKATKISEIGD